MKRDVKDALKQALNEEVRGNPQGFSLAGLSGRVTELDIIQRRGHLTQDQDGLA